MFGYNRYGQGRSAKTSVVENLEKLPNNRASFDGKFLRGFQGFFLQISGIFWV